MKKILSNNDRYALEVVRSLLTSYLPKGKYIACQQRIRSLEIAYEKKVDDKNKNGNA